MASPSAPESATAPSGGARASGPSPLRLAARHLRAAGAFVGATLRKNRVSLLLLVTSVGIAIGIFFLLGATGIINLPFILKYLPTGAGPAELSLEFTTFTFLLGMAGAIGLGMVRAFPPRRSGTSRKGLLWRWPLYGFASGYVAAIRGTPFLVQYQIVYYAIIFSYPRLTFLGWDATYLAGFFALLINTTGYQAEAFRGGFQSVDAGQTEAARAVGLTRIQTFVTITLPQSLRLITLPLTNEWISNFKTATILSILGIVELFYWSRIDIAFHYARGLEAFVMLAIYYLVINVTVSRVMTYVEKVRRIPGLGTPVPEVALSRRLLGFGSAPQSGLGVAKAR